MPDNALTTPRYRRLRGLRFTGGFARAALRMADDHLLLCDFRLSFVERYRRFYFRDIEAFVVRKSPGWIGFIVAWLVAALLVYLIAGDAHWNFYVTLVLESICGLFIIRNLIRGPTCRTHIQTAVQTDALPMLNRVWKTNRVFGYLFPLIRAAQADIKSDTAAPPIPATAFSVGATPGPVTVSAEPGVDQLGSRQRAPLSTPHLLTFLSLLLAGLAAILNVTTRSYWSFIATLILFFAALLGGIGCLIYQVRHPVSRAASVFTWAFVILFVLGGLGVNGGYGFYDMTLRIRPASAVPPEFRQLSPLAMRTMAGFDYVLWIFGFSAVLFGLAGLISVFVPAFARTQPPPIPRSPGA